MRKIISITAILIVVYLLVANGEMYKQIFADLTRGFVNMWSALTRG